MTTPLSPLTPAERTAFQASEVILTIPIRLDEQPDRSALKREPSTVDESNQRTLLLYGKQNRNHGYA